jgi:hypothetical protein
MPEQREWRATMPDRPPSLEELRERLERDTEEGEKAVAESQWIRRKLRELVDRILRGRQREKE